MNNQQEAAVLEIISFFLVGLDLYGKERLAKMQEGILEVSDKLYSKITDANNFEWDKNRNSKFLRTVYVISALTEVVFITLFLIEDSPPGDILSQPWYTYVFLALAIMAALVIFFGMIMLAVLMSVLVLILICIVLAKALNYFLRLIIWAFRLYKIEGVFLFIGTMLFILSKYVQLF